MSSDILSAALVGLGNGPTRPRDSRTAKMLACCDLTPSRMTIGVGLASEVGDIGRPASETLVEVVVSCSTIPARAVLTHDVVIFVCGGLCNFDAFELGTTTGVRWDGLTQEVGSKAAFGTIDQTPHFCPPRTASVSLRLLRPAESHVEEEHGHGRLCLLVYESLVYQGMTQS